MKKLYLAGPMTGKPYFNFPSFDAHAEELRDLGFEVFSPADHDRELLGKPVGWLPTEEDSEGPWQKWSIPNAPSLRKMLGDDTSYICNEATHIAFLKGWENSKGARAEWALANALDLEMIYL